MDLISPECRVPWTKVLNKQVPIQDYWDWGQWNSVFYFVFSVGNTERTSQEYTHKTTVLRPVPDCGFRRPLGFDHWDLERMELRRVLQKNTAMGPSQCFRRRSTGQTEEELRTAVSSWWAVDSLWHLLYLIIIRNFPYDHWTLLLVCRSLFSKTCIWLEGKS